MDSMDKYYNMSMVDVAYELMSKKKSAVNFFQIMGRSMSNEEI